jgi:hypothetical protein
MASSLRARLFTVAFASALAFALVLGLALASEAAAYTCPATPLQQRIDQADIVFVGRSTGFRTVPGSGLPQRVYTFVVDQQVKGDLGRTVAVRIPVLAANGGQKVPMDVAAGILASRIDGGWFTTTCGITDPGAVLAEVDEPRGNAIKLAIGAAILAAVLAYSIRRVRKKQGAAGGGSLAP